MADLIEVGGGITIAANLITNVEMETVFADNATVGTSYELVSNNDADITQLGSSGDGIEISSDDANDTSDGTGARTVKVEGLDTSFAKKETTLTMNGTSKVEDSDTDWTFVNKAYLLTAGSGLAAAGDLTIQDDGASNTQMIIEAGNYQGHNCWWKVPAGHTGYVPGFWGQVAAQATSAGAVYFALQVAVHGLQGVASSETYETFAEIVIPEHDSDVAATTNGDSRGYFVFPGGPIKIPEKSIVRLAAKSSDGSTAVTGGFNIFIQGSGAGTTTTVN